MAEDDIELVHDELRYPAFAEVLGFKMVNTGFHPGFFKQKPGDTSIFTCMPGHDVSLTDIRLELEKSNGQRAFHPVKTPVSLDDILACTN